MEPSVPHGLSLARQNASVGEEHSSEELFVSLPSICHGNSDSELLFKSVGTDDRQGGFMSEDGQQRGGALPPPFTLS
ncbi:hypothetical protein H920_02495 [Fukomys damarensis]|uniref:Uncharacterized protein n=1 Tax=Fukomys damarensis TaxID=885580 RepID=A0A091EKN9_FUKDA|nr:hypothetical protein H920_02495 [Fukomys damarensis]